MQPINIVIDLKSADALNKLNTFLQGATSGLRRLAEEAVASYVSIEGLRKIVDIGKDVLGLQENIGKLSQQTGISVESIAALRSVAVSVGLPFQQLETTLGRFSANIYLAATTGGKAAQAFHDMRISLLETDDSLRSTDDILRDFLVKFREMPDGPQKTAIAMKISGLSAREAIPFLNQAADAMTKVGETSPISPESVAQATQFNRTIRELSEAFEMVFVEVANKVLPVFMNLANDLPGATHSADAHTYAVEGILMVFKSLVTAGSVVALVIYDIGKALGDVAAIWVENFKVAMNTAKALVQDITKLLSDQLTLILDIGKGMLNVVEAQGALMTGHFGTAKELIAQSFSDIKGDAKSLGADVVKSASDVGVGVVQMFQNNWSISTQFIDDVKNQWNGMSKFLGDLWGDRTKAPTASVGGGAPAKIFPASTQDIKDLTQLQSLIQEIYKQQEKLVTSDPFKSQAEKAAELVVLLNEQKQILFDEYAAAEKALNNPNLDEAKKLTLKREMVKLQGQLNDLEGQERDINLRGDFVGQMQKGIIALNDRVTDFSTNAANLALTTLQRGIDAVSASMFAAMQGTKNWGDAFAKAMNQAVQGIIQMVSQWIAGKLAMMAVDAAFSAKSKTDSASTTAASVPGGIAKAGEQGGWVGILIYVGVFLAAMAALMAITSAVARERGGPVQSGMPYIVGEKRPELFIPDQSGHILPEVPAPAQAPGGDSSGGTMVNLAFHGGEADAQRWAKSQEGQTFIVDTNRRNVRRITRT